MRSFFSLSQSVGSIVMALSMAVIVWVAASSLQLVRLTYPSAALSQGIPIQLLNKSEGLMVLQGEAQFVRADISILGEERDRLQVSDFVAEADLTDLGPGEHQVPVTIRTQPYAPPARLIGPVPDRIIVELDEVITRTLPIEVELLDRNSLPQTYQVLSTTVDPPEITISGPRTVVEPIETVVAQARIEGARETVIRTTSPQFIGLDTTQSQWLTTNVNQLSVQVGIGLRPGYRDLIVRTDIQGEPAAGYWVSGITPEPQLVTVVGQPEVISGLNGIVSTEPINVEGLGEGAFQRAARLQLPEGVTPLNEGFVQVRIQIEPQTSSKRVSVRPLVTGLQPGLVVSDTAIVPSEVTVLLQGPISELENLDLEDVVVTLDVTGKPLGTHLITPVVEAPGTLQAESVNPELVEVTIVEEQVSRDVTVPVTVEGQRGSQVVVMEPPTITMTLQGPVSLLKGTAPPTTTVAISVGALSNGQYVLTPTVTLPDKVSVAVVSPITVTILSGQDVLNVTEQVQVRNLPPGFRATLSEPTITVRVAPRNGAQRTPVLDDVQVFVDLGAVEAGVVRVRPIIEVGEGFILVGVLSEEIEITIRAQ